MLIIWLSEWNALKETHHLLGDPANAAFLRRGVEALNAGRGEEHELLDPNTVGNPDASHLDGGRLGAVRLLG